MQSRSFWLGSYSSAVALLACFLGQSSKQTWSSFERQKNFSEPKLEEMSFYKHLQVIKLWNKTTRNTCHLFASKLSQPHPEKDFDILLSIGVYHNAMAWPWSPEIGTSPIHRTSPLRLPVLLLLRGAAGFRLVFRLFHLSLPSPKGPPQAGQTRYLLHHMLWFQGSNIYTLR